MNLQYLCHKCKNLYSITDTPSNKSQPYHYLQNHHKTSNLPLSPKEKLKCLVSQTRYRLYDPVLKSSFDLSYIEPRVIAMAVPCSFPSTLWRNSTAELEKFLSAHHYKKHYKVYNLCSEPATANAYKPKNFNNNWTNFKIPDHGQPTFSTILKFCHDAVNFLKEDKKNIIVIHCKAGKGRTGTLACCLFIYCSFLISRVALEEHTGRVNSNTKTQINGISKLLNHQILPADHSIQYHGTRRTYIKRCITIPSQKLALRYFEIYLRNIDKLKYVKTSVMIAKITLEKLPTVFGRDMFCEINGFILRAVNIEDGNASSKTKNCLRATFEIPKKFQKLTSKSTINFYHKKHRNSQKPIFSITFDPFFHRLEKNLNKQLEICPLTLTDEDLLHNNKSLRKPSCNKCNRDNEGKKRAFSGSQILNKETERENLLKKLDLDGILNVDFIGTESGFTSDKKISKTENNPDILFKTGTFSDNFNQNLVNERIVEFSKSYLDEFHKYFKVAEKFPDEFKVLLDCKFE